MASHQQPSPTIGMPPHYGGPHQPHAPVNGHPLHAPQQKTPSQYLGQLTEAVWTQMGTYSNISKPRAGTLADLSRFLVGADERPRGRHAMLRAGAQVQPVVCASNAGHRVHLAHERCFPRRSRVSQDHHKGRQRQW
jgi:hypothetical protein